MAEPPGDSEAHGDESVSNLDNESRSKKFRFKSHTTESRDRHTRNHSTQQPSPSRDSHRHHHRRKRRKTTPPLVDDPSAYDDSIHDLPPDAAFRESLFDALGDDEGAAFWEGVYGQPIHHYPSTSVNHETGKLEQMTDEEYAQYVRRKMWEKSYEGVEAEREERRKRQREEAKEKAHGVGGRNKADFEKGRIFDLEVQESLQRGEQRKLRRHWKRLWGTYLQRWTDLHQLVENRAKETSTSDDVHLRNKIAWPVESGKRDDVKPEEIERFICNGTRHTNPDLDQGVALLSALKTERVRWHPDKIQQRYGSFGLDEKISRDVTAVFQVIDRMWSERKTQK